MVDKISPVQPETAPITEIIHKVSGFIIKRVKVQVYQ